MKPSEYPLSSEMKPGAGYISSTMAPTQLIPELSETTTAVAAAPSEK